MKLSNAAFLLVTTIVCAPSLYASAPASASSSSAVGSEEKSDEVELLTADEIRLYALEQTYPHKMQTAKDLHLQKRLIYAKSILKIFPQATADDLGGWVVCEIRERLRQEGIRLKKEFNGYSMREEDLTKLCATGLEKLDEELAKYETFSKEHPEEKNIKEYLDSDACKIQ